MIELNLLPEEFRKKDKVSVQLPKIPAIPVVAAVTVGLILIYTFLTFLLVNKKHLLLNLSGKWQEMEPQRKKVAVIDRKIRDAGKKVEALRKIAKPDIDWTEILNGLNAAMIDDVWLSDLKLVTDKNEKTKGFPISLDIAGYAIAGTGNQGTTVVARFLTSLKDKNSFSKYFRDIELRNMLNRQIGKDDVMMFSVVCRFKSIEPVKIDRKSSKRKGRKKKK